MIDAIHHRRKSFVVNETFDNLEEMSGPGRTFEEITSSAHVFSALSSYNLHSKRRYHSLNKAKVTQFVDNSLTFSAKYCGNDDVIEVGDLIVGTSSGAWAKAINWQQNLAPLTTNDGRSGVLLSGEVISVSGTSQSSSSVEEEGERCYNLEIKKIIHEHLFESFRKESSSPLPASLFYQAKGSSFPDLDAIAGGGPDDPAYACGDPDIFVYHDDPNTYFFSAEDDLTYVHDVSECLLNII